MKSDRGKFRLLVLAATLMVTAFMTSAAFAIDCPAGKQPNTANDTCIDACKFWERPGLLACGPFCKLGSINTPTEFDADHCSPCPAGTTTDPTTNKCVTCNGTVTPEGTCQIVNKPASCPSGQYYVQTPNSFAIVCGTCTGNTYKEPGTQDVAVCHSCGPGLKASDDHAYCLPDGPVPKCPAGSQPGLNFDKPGAVVGFWECSPCPTNTFGATPGQGNSEKGKQICMACPAGATSPPGSTTCSCKQKGYHFTFNGINGVCVQDFKNPPQKTTPQKKPKLPLTQTPPPVPPGNSRCGPGSRCAPDLDDIGNGGRVGSEPGAHGGGGATPRPDLSPPTRGIGR